jgi:3-deoxy-manno-octulosonate cytidylyltransferase (CMP-KDO synthetase)
MSVDFNVVIPARFASTRLPAKVLAMIGDKPMVQHVYEKALESGAKEVVIATDHPDVEKLAKKIGATCCMTSVEHINGSVRIAEAVQLMGWDPDQIVVNLQGDEPLFPSHLVIEAVHALVNDKESQVGTVCVPITDVDDLFNPNIVKVILNAKQRAMYFSRAPIPWDRNGFSKEPKQTHAPIKGYRHVGVYCCRVEFFKQFSILKEALIETSEQLEQLRLMYAGHQIALNIVNAKIETAVDTAEDLEKIRLIYAGQTRAC